MRDQVLERARPVLGHLGTRVFHCGGPAAGAAAKVCNNAILALQMLGVAEGFALAEAMGLDLATFQDVVNSSSGRSWTTESYSPVPDLKRDGAPGRGYALPGYQVTEASAAQRRMPELCTQGVFGSYFLVFREP